MDTEFSHWVEWKQKCDLRLCGPQTQGSLHAYVGKRLRKLVSRSLAEIRRALVDTHELDGWMCWDLFEGFYADRESRSGRRYKDWLFATVQSSSDNHVDVMEREVNELLYNVVRQFIRTHYPRRDTASLDAPLREEDSGTGTLMDILPHRSISPSDDAELRDARNVAAGFAADFFEGMSRRERVALAVRGLDLPLSCREAEEAAGCKKSVLSDAGNRVYQGMIDRLRQVFPEDVEVLRFYVVEALVEKCIEWARGDRSCETIFRLLAQRGAEGGHQ